MPTTKKPKKADPAKPSPAKKPAGAPTPERLSALDAAAQVLVYAPADGVSAKDLIAEMEAKGLWVSPAGKTPHATLAAAIVREINTKGEGARFARLAPGRFALAQPGKKPRPKPARAKVTTPKAEPAPDAPSTPAPRKRRRAGAAK